MAIDDAKIIGMTPDMLTLSGRCVASAVYFASYDLLAYCAPSLRSESVMNYDECDYRDENNDKQSERKPVYRAALKVPARKAYHGGPRKQCWRTGLSKSVADTVVGDLLAEAT